LKEENSMSLVTLTFGAKKTNYMPSANALISSPSTRMNQKMGGLSSVTGTLLVKKACRFYSQENVFVVAEVTDGFIAENMKAYLDDREVQIIEVESKHGHNAKKGMAVGVFLSGIDETELPEGFTLQFKSA